MRGESMKADPRIKGVAILAAAGLLLTVVVLFLFYGISVPLSRSETFVFTAWFSAAQVLLLFSSLVYTAIKDGHPGSVIPVNSATVIATFIYNVAAVLTILLFTLYLFPRFSSARTYYVICVAELGVAAAYLVLLQLVAVAHKVGHTEALESRATIDGLVRMCDAISSNAASIGWKLDMRRCMEQIRFSEGLRRDTTLPSEVARLLEELETLTNMAPEEPAVGEAKKLISGIEALARRGN
jgi:hypothetical protein